MNFKLINNQKIIFKNMPLTNDFKINIRDEQRFFKPTLKFDDANSYFYLSKPCPYKKLKPKFSWLTCYEPEKHLDKLVLDILKKKIISKNDDLCFLSFKDTTLAKRFEKKGFKKINYISPKKDLKIREKNFLTETIQQNFQNGALRVSKFKSKYNFLFARHIFEHVQDLNLFLENAMYTIKENGYLLLEIPDCTRAINNGDPTLYWEEHNFYFTSESFKKFLQKCKYKITYYNIFHDKLENCLVAILQKKKKLSKTIYHKKKNNSIQTYYKLLKNNYTLTQKFFRELGNYKIAFYGASHLTFTFIEIMNLNKYVNYIIDDNPNKRNLISPVCNLRILNSQDIKNENIQFFFLGLNPVHHVKVLKCIYPFFHKSKFFSIFPETKYYYLNK